MYPISEMLLFAGLLIAAGGVAGLLAGIFGIGGGAVLVPVFYQVFGLAGVPESVAMHLSVGTSLAVIVPTSFRSLSAHRKHGAVDMQLLKQWVIAVPLGTILASLIVASASSEALRAIFATLMLLLAVRMLVNRSTWSLGSDLPGEPWSFMVGTGIGLLSGLVGIGGGVLNNTFMTLYGRTIHQAVATSAGLGVLISIPGLFGYIWAGWGDGGLPPISTGFVNWIAVALIFPITFFVAPMGAKLAHAMSKRQLEVGFAIFLLLMSARFYYSLIG